MPITISYYRYEGYSYRIEKDDDRGIIACYELQLDGSWLPVSWGWQIVTLDNLPITEEQAYLLAGIKKPT